MALDRITAFLNRKYRPNGCCCFSLKVGSTIIGVWDITASIIMIFVSHFQVVIVDEENSAVKVIRGDATVLRIVANMCRIIFIAIAAAMVWGNIKGNTKLMIPYVYVKCGSFIFIVIHEILLTLTLLCLARFKDAVVNFIFIFIIIVAVAYFWQIVQCRIIEIDEMVRPDQVRTQGDPEIPILGNVQGTLMQGTVPSIPPFLKDPINSPPINTAISH